MKLLLGEQFSHSGCTTSAESLKRGRILLCQITGKDFGYDAHRWHEYLVETDAGGYTLNDEQSEFANRIAQLEGNGKWQEARRTLEALPQPPYSAPDPDFFFGDAVEVILGDRNTTYRKGIVRDVIWHFKSQCWNFYLETKAEGNVSKRYFADDLRRIETRDRFGSEQGAAPNP